MSILPSRDAILPPLQLLEDVAGDVALDAIVIHTGARRTWWEALLGLKPYSDKTFLVPPTAERRMARYETAACLFPLHKDARKAQLRYELGYQFNQAWKRGERPQLRLINEHMPALKKRRHLRVVA